MKKFATNFILSLIAYLIACFIGVLAWIGIIWGSYSGWLNAIGITSDTPDWIFALVFYGSFVLNTGISAMLFFFLGRKLNLLGKHWLNYLSFIGSLIVVMILGLGFLDVYGLLVAILPFVMLWAVIEFEIIRTGDGGFSIIFMCIIATLPLIITWLGMLHKSRKA